MDIDILLALQSFREGSGAFLTDFFLQMSRFGEMGTFIIVAAAVYWCFDKRLGVYLFLGWHGNRLLNGVLKVTACAYRPWIRDSRIVPDPEALSAATGYSFPSGHSMNASSLFGGGALYRGIQTALRVLLLLIVALIAFSRIFLTVHTPQDILVGTAVGVGFMYCGGKILDYVEAHPKSDWIVAAAFLLAAVLIAVFASVKSYPEDFDAANNLLVDGHKMANDTYKAVGWSLAFFVGWLLERRYVQFSVKADLGNKALRLTGGLLGYYFVNLAICPLIKSGVGGDMGTICSCFAQMLYVILLVPCAIKFAESGTVDNSGQAPDMR